MSSRSRQSDKARSVEYGGAAGGDESGGESSSPLIRRVRTASIDMDEEVAKERSTVTATATATMTAASSQDGDCIEIERDHQNPPPIMSPGTVKKKRPQLKERLEPSGRRQQGIAVRPAAV